MPLVPYKVSRGYFVTRERSKKGVMKIITPCEAGQKGAEPPSLLCKERLITLWPYFFAKGLLRSPYAVRMALLGNAKKGGSYRGLRMSYAPYYFAKGKKEVGKK